MNITSTEENELTGDELGIIMEYIRQKAETDVNITWGYMMDPPESGEEIGITMIATGFGMNDIPDLRKPEEPVKHVLRRPGQGPQVLTEPSAAPQTGSQGELFANDDVVDISINKTKFDYAKVREMDDISILEEQPAFLRQQQISNVAAQPTTQSRAQAISEDVANRIQGTAPSQFSLDKDSKGLILGDNKYLNHNVD